MIINPSKVKPNEQVNINLRITNASEITVNDTVVLKVNNLIVDSQDVILTGGVSKEVTFKTSGQLPGNYTVSVAGLNGNFTISKSVIPSWLWPVSVGAFVLGIILAVFFTLVIIREDLVFPNHDQIND